MLNNKKLYDLVNSAFEIHMYSQHDLFIKYSPHIDTLTIYVYKFGWSENKDDNEVLQYMAYDDNSLEYSTQMLRKLEYKSKGSSDLKPIQHLFIKSLKHKHNGSLFVEFMGHINCIHLYYYSKGWSNTDSIYSDVRVRGWNLLAGLEDAYEFLEGLDEE